MSNILFVLDIDLSINGASSHLLTDIINCAKSSFEQVTVFCINNNEDKLYRDGNVAYYSFFLRKKKRTIFARLISVSKYKKILKKFLNNQRFDISFVQSSISSYLYIKNIKLHSRCVVTNIQDIFPYNLHYSHQLPFDFILFPILKRLQRITYKNSDLIITISDDMKNTLVYDGVRKDKISVIYNWSYSDKIISLESIDNFFNLKCDRTLKNIVYAGNIGVMQNIAELIAAFKTINNESPYKYHFYIIGNGSKLSTVLEEINECDYITYLPLQNSVYAESIYCQADLNIIPLVKGGIFTALPSKTPTIMRTLNKALFCLDSNSIFSRQISCYKDTFVCEMEEKRIVSTIHSIFDDGEVNNDFKKDRQELISSKMSVENAKKYIEEFEKVIGEKK